MRSASVSNPIVSVIIPTFNRAALIGASIESVLAQSFENFELVVVDDGSTDSTAAVVSSYNDARLIYIRQDHRGRSAARNSALQRVRGKYIAFLDSDDLYLKEKLERQVPFMEAHPDIGMIYTSAVCIDEQGNLLKTFYRASAEGWIYKSVAFFQPVTITLPTVMVRREVLADVCGFDEKMDRFEDTDLWRRISKRYKVGIMEEPSCRLRTHRDNTLRSQDPQRIVEAIDYYVQKIFREDADMGQQFLNNGASLLYEYYGNAFLSVPEWRRLGVALLVKSVQYSPVRGVSIAKLHLARLFPRLMRGASIGKSGLARLVRPLIRK